MSVKRAALLLVTLSAMASPATARAGQPLETESARLIRRGGFKLESGFEAQSSSAGTEAAVPLAFEYGVADRLELLVEPVVYSAIHDRGAARVSGLGDTEVTLTSLISRERPLLPAMALAAEAKIPTAKNERIGSGKADYSFFLIGSKRVGSWDTHANVGLTLIGRPSGAQVNNVANFAFAEEFHRSVHLDLVAEVFGSTAALKESPEGGTTPSPESQLTPEIGAAEAVGTLGVRYRTGAGGLVYSFGLSVDNNSAVLVHPGVTFTW